MAVRPTITQYPPYPARGEAPEDYVTKADAFHNKHIQRGNEENALGAWMKDTADNAVDAAQDSASDAAIEAGKAKSERLLTNADRVQTGLDRDQTGADVVSSGAFAAAAGSAAGLPEIAGKANSPLTVKADGSGVEWRQAQGVRVYKDVFNSSGTWTKRPGAFHVEVEAIGGGGSGQRVTTGTGQGGQGGIGLRDSISATTLPGTVAVIVGAGGSAVTATAKTNGADGGESSFGTYAYGPGGQGGNDTIITTGKAYDASALFAGYGINHSSSIYGGGGGGFGGIGDGTGGSSKFAGAGGEGKRDANGDSGTAPGGGGGGSYGSSSLTTGAGAKGRVTVTTYVWEGI